MLDGPQPEDPDHRHCEGDVLAQNQCMAQVFGLVAEAAVEGTLSCADSVCMTIPDRGVVYGRRLHAISARAVL